MAVLVTAIHAFIRDKKTWMAGTSPAMTVETLSHRMSRTAVGRMRGKKGMTASAHLDTFSRDNLPPREQWPDFLFTLPELNYPERINCVVELLDRWIAAGHGDRPC